MSQPTPRSVAPSQVQRLDAVIDALAGISGIEELSTQEAIIRLEEAQQALASALNPVQPGLPGLGKAS